MGACGAPRARDAEQRSGTVTPELFVSDGLGGDISMFCLASHRAELKDGRPTTSSLHGERGAAESGRLVAFHDIDFFSRHGEGGGTKCRGRVNGGQVNSRFVETCRTRHLRCGSP